MNAKKLLSVMGIALALIFMAPADMQAKKSTKGKSHKKSTASQVAAISYNANDNNEYIKFFKNGKIQRWGWEDGAYFKDNDNYVIMDGHGLPIVIVGDNAYQLSDLDNFDGLTFFLQCNCQDFLNAPYTLSDVMWFNDGTDILYFRDGDSKTSSYDLRNFPKDKIIPLKWSK